MTVWKPGEQPKPAKQEKGISRPPKLLQRAGEHQPVSPKELATSLPLEAWKNVSWRQGARANSLHGLPLFVAGPLTGITGALNLIRKNGSSLNGHLVILREKESTKYWLSTLPADTRLAQLVSAAKHRWIIERNHQELKQELGVGHFEGRGWRGFHHHASLCIAAYGILVSERSPFSPQPAATILNNAPPRHPTASARGVRAYVPSGIIRIRSPLCGHFISRYLLGSPPRCPFCGSRSG